MEELWDVGRRFVVVMVVVASKELEVLDDAFWFFDGDGNQI
jgi:hypothetical protein